VDHFKTFVEEYAPRFANDEERMDIMRMSNPRYVLKNWMAQRAIEKADEGDFSEVIILTCMSHNPSSLQVRKLLKVLRRPFELQEEAEEGGYASPPPKWSRNIRVSCSS